ncbi:hypothetical protein TRIP_C21264 [Candidatus Zixiibacteriota bacterium]|nr:hypothetical protein TRIP_C21264 [candidate division Zixibacteria bacterium]
MQSGQERVPDRAELFRQERLLTARDGGFPLAQGEIPDGAGRGHSCSPRQNRDGARRSFYQEWGEVR